MELFKYELQKFFDDELDEAKLQAAIQFYFKFSREIYEDRDMKELEK